MFRLNSLAIGACVKVALFIFRKQNNPTSSHFQTAAPLFSTVCNVESQVSIILEDRIFGRTVKSSIIYCVIHRLFVEID